MEHSKSLIKFKSLVADSMTKKNSKKLQKRGYRCMLYMGQVFVHGEKDVTSTPRMMGVSIG